jgi:hypothetical protein
MRRCLWLFVCLALCVGGPAVWSAPAGPAKASPRAALPVAAAIDPALLAGMKARSIGPAGMSGRVAALEATPSDPRIVYAGAATGGVWKSTNSGLTWTPVFDDQPVHAIGAIAISAVNAETVWVGTGEGNLRNSASVGGGVFRSLDGGKTWTLLGLEATERIHRIVLHPTNPEVAWVAALGREWGENPERGVFKTVDGGKTWRCGPIVAGPTSFAAVAPGRVCMSARMAAKRGRSVKQKTGSPRVNSVVSVWRFAAVNRTWSMRWLKRRRARCCAPMMGARVSRASTPIPTLCRGRFTSLNCASIRCGRIESIRWNTE